MDDNTVSVLTLLVSMLAISICAIIISLDREQYKVNSDYSIYNNNHGVSIIYDD